MSGAVIYERAKRGGMTVRATIAEFQGSRFLDIREWAEQAGQPLATRKGVTMPLDAMRELGEALIAASASNDSSGLPTAA